jgi:hypothetical protein
VPVNGIENFRGYAKRLLKACHGGFNRNLRFFIREGGLDKTIATTKTR